MRKSAALTLITMLAVVAAGAMTSADAKSAKKGTKGTQQQQYLQIKLQDAYISSARSAPSSRRNPAASGVSRSSR
jgi:type VI protein secretion system component Hcp